MDSIIKRLGISQEDYINTVNECIFDKSIQPGDNVTTNEDGSRFNRSQLERVISEQTDKEIEEAALKVYPPNISYSTISDQMYDYNAERRLIWIEGAKWGKHRTIDKSCDYLREHKDEVQTEDNGIAGWISEKFIHKFKRKML